MSTAVSSTYARETIEGLVTDQLRPKEDTPPRSLTHRKYLSLMSQEKQPKVNFA